MVMFWGLKCCGEWGIDKGLCPLGSRDEGSLYRLQQSCGQGNIFAPVCHSVQRGMSASVHAGIPHPLVADTPWEQTSPLEQTPPLGADTPQSRHPWSRHPPEQTPPGADSPQEQTSPGANTSLEQTPPQSRLPGSRPPWEQTPPWEADSGIRSMSGRYTSYWNAFLCNSKIGPPPFLGGVPLSRYTGVEICVESLND